MQLMFHYLECIHRLKADCLVYELSRIMQSCTEYIFIIVSCKKLDVGFLCCHNIILLDVASTDY